MPVRRFSIPGDATRREFSIYAVVATKVDGLDWYVYVGKTGDNRAGCNPVASRAGNHFSYNDAHSQVRTKLAPASPHEFNFEYFYVTIHPYLKDDGDMRGKIDSINEMERFANKAIYAVLPEQDRVRLLNPYRGAGYVSQVKRAQRAALRTLDAQAKIARLAETVADYVRTLTVDLPSQRQALPLQAVEPSPE